MDEDEAEEAARRADAGERMDDDDEFDFELGGGEEMMEIDA